MVDGRDAARTARLIGDLDGQTYPRELIEVIVACPPDAGFLPADAETESARIRRQRVDTFDAEAANALVRSARGSVVAFTDDACRLPAGWVESGLRAMGQYTAALSGGVLADTTSAAPFLALPGRRRKNSGSGLFLAANSFYVRAALLQVGGFDENAHADWGWDSTASARLAAAGFPVSQDATAFVFRHFAFAPNRAWIREEFDFAAAIPSGVRRMPGLRSTALHHGVFASERTLAFDVLVVGLGVAALRRNPWYAVAGSIPWLRTVGEFVDFWPPAEWRTSMRHVRGAGIRSAVWAAGLAVGSVRARKVVL